MIKIKLIADIKKDLDIVAQIIDDCKNQWGYSEEFLKRLFDSGEILAIAKNKSGEKIGFSLASKIILKESIAIAFLATRVSPEYRNRGIAGALIKRITGYFVIQNKIFEFSNWLKSVYFVTATANPIVFEALRRHSVRKIVYDSKEANKTEFQIAEKFAEILAKGENFEREKFIVKSAFVNSAEFYVDDTNIPWSANEEINEILKEKIKYNERTGNGIVVLNKLF